MTPHYIQEQETPPERGRRAKRLAMLLVAFLAVAGGSGGTWAAFTASTTNSASFSTGVLMLSNTREEASACFSTATGDQITTNDAACDELFTLSAQAPGASDSVEITIRNEGNLDGTLSAFAGEACVTGDAPGDFNGDHADICDDVRVMVQRYTSATNQENDVRTGGECLFGEDGTDNGTCDGFDAAWHLSRFVTDFPDFDQPLGIGTLPADDTGSADTRWFRVFVQLDPDATNAMQGRMATFGISWRLTQ